MTTENINPALQPLARPIEVLKEDPRNARRHDQRSVDAIAESLTLHGQQKPVVALKDGTVIAGNGTLQAARSLGWTRLAAVVFEDVSRARTYALADNRTAELSAWDPAALAADIDAAFGEMPELLETLWTEAEREAVGKALEPPPPPAPLKEPKRVPSGPPRDWRIVVGDNLATLKGMPDGCVDAVVTDPPYELGFMGRAWDSSGVAYSVPLWREVLRVLKPGGFLLAFGGTRTHHRMVCAIEDAGFEVRDMMQWLYGTGFPKSMDVSKALDAAAGEVRKDRKTSSSNNIIFAPTVRPTNKGTPVSDSAVQWDGYGTALKPANEPICVARKPLDGTVAENVQRHGVGGINVDAARLDDAARFPSNVVLDSAAAKMLPEGAERFFYCPKASRGEKEAGLGALPLGSGGVAAGPGGWEEKAVRNIHPTVKPVDLMRYLVTMFCPPGGIVLDPFAGSGSTGIGCLLSDVFFIGLELDTAHACIAWHRLTWWAEHAQAWAPGEELPEDAPKENPHIPQDYRDAVEPPKAPPPPPFVPNPDNGHGAGDGSPGEDFPALGPEPLPAQERVLLFSDDAARWAAKLTATFGEFSAHPAEWMRALEDPAVAEVWAAELAKAPPGPNHNGRAITVPAEYADRVGMALATGRSLMGDASATDAQVFQWLLDGAHAGET